MLKWAVIFFIISIIAAVFGFTGIAHTASSVAKILFFIFLIGFIITTALYILIAVKILK